MGHTSGSAYEQVVVGMVRCRVHDGLDPVQCLHATESKLSDLQQMKTGYRFVICGYGYAKIKWL